MKLPRVRCARCNKPVKLVEVREDHDTGETIITARCHGASERMVFSAASLLHMTNKQLDELRNQEGVAFATARATSLSSTPTPTRRTDRAQVIAPKAQVPEGL